MMKKRINPLQTGALGLMALATAGVALLPANSSAAAERKPNVIIFLTDD